MPVEQRVGAHDCRTRIDVLAEHGARQGDELGAGRGDRLDRGEVAAGQHDAWDLDHLGPPAPEREVAFVRLGPRIIAETPEEHVVRPLLAEVERLVARLGAAGAHHDLVLHAVDHVGELGLAALDMDAVGAHAAGDAGISPDDGRDARSLRKRHDALGKRLERGLVEPVLRQDQRSDIAG